MNLRTCSWCDRVEHRGAWVRPELVIRALETYGWNEPPSFTQTVCPDCFQRVGAARAEARAEGRAAALSG